jgi:hypothetical protein
MMTVPEAAKMPLAPRQTEILAPGICAEAMPRIRRTLINLSFWLTLF